ncbi:Methylmalonate-semialdehyde dehydrogenase [acylating] [compost metagenome]
MSQTMTPPVERRLPNAGTTFNLDQLKTDIREFNDRGQLGLDPLAEMYRNRRAGWSLFTPGMRDEELEALREYLFPYRELPSTSTSEPIAVYNYTAGQWRKPKAGKMMTFNSLYDRRVPFASVPDSQAEDVEEAVSYAFDFWTSLEWNTETVAYRKWVVSNWSRMMEYFYEEVMREIRHEIPKTRLEGNKDYWEAKRAADHIAGNAEKAMRGEIVPQMVENQTYWKNAYIPAGVSAVITPMNFIYGIPGIQIIGCYMAGAPQIFKGHPFGAVSNTVMIRMLLAAGADPRAVQKLEGGAGITSLSSDPRIAVVSVTGSEMTALKITESRGLRPTKFEGGGSNWAWIDDGYSDEELERIAIRLTYSKLGFSSHKCTTLHGIAASPATLKKVIGYVNAEMDRWVIQNPALVSDDATKVIGPNMVHKAQTVTNIQEAARKAGCEILREGGKVTGSAFGYEVDADYAANAEVIAPVILKVTPDVEVTCDWDGKGELTFHPATTEYFMPILCAMELNSFDEYLRFSLITNPHDLANSIWTRDDAKLVKARRILGGMLKENDGTDSALEWEEFGASGIGGSGNMGVGDAETTIAIFCRRQKGRHLVF